VAGRVGVVRYTGGLGPFVSVERLWDQAMAALRRGFEVVAHHTDELDLSGSREVARMLECVDLLVVLLPYHRLPRNRKVPLLLFALGSLQKGAAWLARHRSDLRTSDTLVVNSTTCRDIFLDLADGPSLAARLLPLGIDLTTFRPERVRLRMIRRELRIREDVKVLTYSGRLSLQKNVHVLVTVLDEVRRRGVDAHLLVVGAFDGFVIPEFAPGPPPDVARALRFLIASRGLDRHVTIVEHVEPEALADVLTAGDVGVTLTTFGNENFGLAPVEQQACGLPVVGSDWGGLRDTIRHAETGARVPTLLSRFGARVDYEAAVGHLVDLLSDDDRRARLGAEAAEHAGRFSLPAFERELAAIVEDAMTRPRLVDGVVPCFDEGWQRAVEQATPTHADLRWARLDPSKDFGLYRRVLGRCATATAEDVDWCRVPSVAKAFDWGFDEAGNWSSADPRWHPGYELAGLAPDLLGRDDLSLLRAVDRGCRRVERLCARLPTVDVRSRMATLTERGFVLPRWSLPQALAATSARRR